MGEPGSPIPPPAGGCGRENPSYADRPLPHLPPLRAGTGRLPPAGGGCEGVNPVSPSPCGCGPEARAPTPPGRCERSPCAGVWGNRVSPRPRPAGEWGNRVSPFPDPREGLGGLRPPRKNLMFIAALCGGAAWRAEVKTVRRVQPPSQPPPAGGRSRVPSPAGGGSGREPSPCLRSRDAGGTPAFPGHVHRALCAMRMTV